MDADMPEQERLGDEQVALIVEVFRMLADPTRVQILWALVDNESSVNDLADHVGKPAPSVSQHLAKLRMARLVRTRRAGTTIFYSLENEHVRELVADAVFNAEHAGPGVPPHHRSDSTARGISDAPTRKTPKLPPQPMLAAITTPPTTTVAPSMEAIDMPTVTPITTTTITTTRRVCVE